MSDTPFAVVLDRRDAYAFDVTFDHADLPVLRVDEPAPLGAGTGPNAVRLLAAGIGHCLSASLLFCFEKARIEVTALQTRVFGTLVRNEAGRLRVGEVRVELTPTVAPEAHARMGRCLGVFEDYCIATQSVRDGMDVVVSVSPAAPEAAPV